MLELACPGGGEGEGKGEGGGGFPAQLILQPYACTRLDTENPYSIQDLLFLELLVFLTENPLSTMLARLLLFCEIKGVDRPGTNPTSAWYGCYDLCSFVYLAGFSFTV